MIKLIDLLQEEFRGGEIKPEMHWRDHFKKIIENAENALMSKDPETIAEAVGNIIDHAEVAREKHEATYDGQKPSTFINSNSYNSYNGDDSDFAGYDYAGIGNTD